MARLGVVFSLAIAYFMVTTDLFVVSQEIPLLNCTTQEELHSRCEKREGAICNNMQQAGISRKDIRAAKRWQRMDPDEARKELREEFKITSFLGYDVRPGCSHPHCPLSKYQWSQPNCPNGGRIAIFVDGTWRVIVNIPGLCEFTYYYCRYKDCWHGYGYQTNGTDIWNPNGACSKCKSYLELTEIILLINGVPVATYVKAYVGCNCVDPEYAEWP